VRSEDGEVEGALVGLGGDDGWDATFTAFEETLDGAHVVVGLDFVLVIAVAGEAFFFEERLDAEDGECVCVHGRRGSYKGRQGRLGEDQKERAHACGAYSLTPDCGEFGQTKCELD
jgi:hypothetical protein